MVHSNIQSSGVNLKKAVKGAGRARIPCARPAVLQRGTRYYSFDSFEGGRVAPSQPTISSVDDLVVGFYDFLFSGFTFGFTLGILCVRFGAVIGLLLRTFVAFGRL